MAKRKRTSPPPPSNQGEKCAEYDSIAADERFPSTFLPSGGYFNGLRHRQEAMNGLWEKYYVPYGNSNRQQKDAIVQNMILPSFDQWYGYSKDDGGFQPMSQGDVEYKVRQKLRDRKKQELGKQPWVEVRLPKPSSGKRTTRNSNPSPSKSAPTATTSASLLPLPPSSRAPNSNAPPARAAAASSTTAVVEARSSKSKGATKRPSPRTPVAQRQPVFPRFPRLPPPKQQQQQQRRQRSSRILVPPQDATVAQDDDDTATEKETAAFLAVLQNALAVESGTSWTLGDAARDTSDPKLLENRHFVCVASALKCLQTTVASQQVQLQTLRAHVQILSRRREELQQQLRTLEPQGSEEPERMSLSVSSSGIFEEMDAMVGASNNTIVCDNDDGDGGDLAMIYGQEGDPTGLVALSSDIDWTTTLPMVLSPDFELLPIPGFENVDYEL